jgi:ribonuclease HI
VKEGAGLGFVFVAPLGVRMRYVVHVHFPASNNVAEYEALINDLCIAIELGIRRLEVRGNSRLVVDQVMKESSYLSTKMASYCRNCKISSIASKLTTSQDGSMKQPTHWKNDIEPPARPLLHLL